MKKSYKTSAQNILKIALIREEELLAIEKLPEEILIHVFKCLPIADLVRIERVRKSWRETARKSWVNMKELRMDSLYSELKSIPVVLDIHILEAIVKRCGRYLEKIDIYTKTFPSASCL